MVSHKRWHDSGVGRACAVRAAACGRSSAPRFPVGMEKYLTLRHYTLLHNGL